MPNLSDISGSLSNREQHPLIHGMRIFLFICALLGILGGFAENSFAKTVFQQIAAGQMILGGFVCLSAAAIIEVANNSVKQTAQVVVGLEVIRDSLLKTYEALEQIAVRIQITNEKIDAAIYKHEKISERADVIGERTNQLLEWVGAVQQKKSSTNAS